MFDRLRADGPPPHLADQLDLFGRFVGAWDLEWHGRDLAGVPIVVSGELYFGWILGGAAIQDVWRVPLDPGDGRSEDLKIALDRHRAALVLAADLAGDRAGGYGGGE